MAGWFDPLMTRIRTDWRFLGSLLAADVAGIIGGYYYYYEAGQFDPSSIYFQKPFWWPLVADSPNAVLLFFVALVAWKRYGWRSKVLDALAFTLNIYVGLWTAYLFLAYPELGALPVNKLLFVTHLGMPLQAFVLLPKMREDRWNMLLAMAVTWFLALFVYVDYWGPRLHPAPAVNDALLRQASPWIMLFAGGLWLILCRPFKARAPAGKAPPLPPGPASP